MSKLDVAFEELNNHGHIEELLMSFHVIDGAIREIAGEDPSNMTFQQIYSALRKAQK